LEAGDWSFEKTVKDIYETHAASLTDRASFEKVLDELSECFVKS